MPRHHGDATRDNPRTSISVLCGVSQEMPPDSRPGVVDTDADGDLVMKLSKPRYLRNKYRHWYDQIIERARSRDLVEGTEKHHILPKAFGGKNDAENIVRLTYREHFLAHWCLPKFTTGEHRRKMLYALGYMHASKTAELITGWRFAIIKKARHDSQVGSKRSDETRAKISAKHSTPEARAKKSADHKGRKHTPEHSASISAALRESEAHKAASEALRDVPRPPKVRAKISKTRIERKIRNSPESIAQQAAKIRGRKDSPETRANKSKAQRDRDPPTEETKTKISVSSLAMDLEDRARITAGSQRPDVRAAKSKALTGRKRPPEDCAAISAGKTGLKATEEAKASLRASWEETREARRAALRAAWVKRRARQASSML